MLLAINDCVYIPSRGVYGKVGDICNVLKDVYYEITINGTCHEKAFFVEDELVKLEVPNFKEGDIVTGLKGADAYVVSYKCLRLGTPAKKVRENCGYIW